MVSDKPLSLPPLVDDVGELPDDGPATRALIETRKRRLAAQADDPPRSQSTAEKRERRARRLDT